MAAFIFSPGVLDEFTPWHSHLTWNRTDLHHVAAPSQSQQATNCLALSRQPAGKTENTADIFIFMTSSLVAGGVHVGGNDQSSTLLFDVLSLSPDVLHRDISLP